MQVLELRAVACSATVPLARVLRLGWLASCSGHLAAFFCALFALVGTLLAMFRPMFTAFGAAGFADVGAQGAHLVHELRASAHIRGGGKADVGAISIEPNTIRHVGHVLFTEAGVGAVLALLRAAKTSFNAGSMFFMGHDVLHLRGCVSMFEQNPSTVVGNGSKYRALHRISRAE